MANEQKCSVCKEQDAALKCSKCKKTFCLSCAKIKITKDMPITMSGNCPNCGWELRRL